MYFINLSVIFKFNIKLIYYCIYDTDTRYSYKINKYNLNYIYLL